MAYDVTLANRIRELIAARENQVEEKLMFGGMCFMVNDKMCVTTREDRIMARIAPEQYEIEILTDHCSPMIARGKEMKGFIFVSGEALRENGQLERWVNMALDFNHVVGAEKRTRPAAKKEPAPAKKVEKKASQAPKKTSKAPTKKTGEKKALKKAAPKKATSKKAAPKKAAKKKAATKVLRKKAATKVLRKKAATKVLRKKAATKVLRKKVSKKASPKKKTRR